MDETNLGIDPIRKLDRDLRAAAESLKPSEARLMVDYYYLIQKQRVRANNQIRALNERPHDLINWVHDNTSIIEKNIKVSLEVYALSHEVGRWSMSLHGIGPVISAGLIAHVDIEKSTSISKLWSFCFPPGTLIDTPEGKNAIELIEPGDQIVDHAGETIVVNETFARFVEEELYSVKARGCLLITATEEHPFLVKNGLGTLWVPARELTPGMLVGIPIVHEKDPVPMRFEPSVKAATKAPLLLDEIEVDSEFAWFAGRYVADGSSTLYREGDYRRGQCELTFALSDSTDEKSRALAIARRFGRACLQLTDSAHQLFFGRLTVAEGFGEWFGSGALNKKIPFQFLGHPDLDILRQFLLGYWSGDGHVVKSGHTAGSGMASTASRVLALQLQQAFLRLGIFAPVHRQERSSTIGEIRGRYFKQFPYRYIISLRAVDMARLRGEKMDEPLYTNRRPVFTEGHVWTPIVSVEKELYSGTVHNLQTTSGSYCAENIAVHNCGLNPTAVWKKGQKRPWNARLKVIAFHVGECFKRTHNSQKSFYGPIYAERKALEEKRNLDGKFADQAKEALSSRNIGKSTEAYRWYKKGMLPPGRLDRRACRYATKLFLSHWWQVLYQITYKKEPPSPWILTQEPHARIIQTPNWPMK